MYGIDDPVTEIPFQVITGLVSGMGGVMKDVQHSENSAKSQILSIEPPPPPGPVMVTLVKKFVELIKNLPDPPTCPGKTDETHPVPGGPQIIVVPEIK